jgi:hypothetical protein
MAVDEHGHDSTGTSTSPSTTPAPAGQTGRGARPSADEQALHDNHGNTRAAWTTVGLLLVATFVMCLAVVLTSVLMFVIGAVVAVAGLAAGTLLSLAGYGAPRPGDRPSGTGAH